LSSSCFFIASLLLPVMKKNTVLAFLVVFFLFDHEVLPYCPNFGIPLRTCPAFPIGGLGCPGVLFCLTLRDLRRAHSPGWPPPNSSSYLSIFSVSFFPSVLYSEVRDPHSFLFFFELSPAPQPPIPSSSEVPPLL